VLIWAAISTLPVIVSGYWVGLFAQAFAYALIFLSWTIVTGEGGMLWLCQITFAGVGALTTAQLANHAHWPVLAGVVVGGLIAMAIGAIIGFLSLRLGDLYVALVTLTFGLLMENLVFTLPTFLNGGLGLSVSRPEFAGSNLRFAYLCLIVLSIVALFIVNLRRSTTGLALNAARWSGAAARMSGISVVQTKVIAGSVAALIAGLGGGLLALAQTSFQASEFATFEGAIWLAVFVTIGLRSNVAALIAALVFVFPSALAQYYFSSESWIPNGLPVLFGMGAIGVALWPEGVVVAQGRWVLKFVRGLRGPRPDAIVLARGDVGAGVLGTTASVSEGVR
jgi:branched-chain amino acid transport system permease protein